MTIITTLYVKTNKILQLQQIVKANNGTFLKNVISPKSIGLENLPNSFVFEIQFANNVDYSNFTNAWDNSNRNIKEIDNRNKLKTLKNNVIYYLKKLVNN